jgi:hypothetical protein
MLAIIEVLPTGMMPCLFLKINHKAVVKLSVHLAGI